MLTSTCVYSISLCPRENVLGPLETFILGMNWSGGMTNDGVGAGVEGRRKTEKDEISPQN